MVGGHIPSQSIRLFLVRHGQSEANLDKTVNARLPDHRIELSAEGQRQAERAGQYLATTLSAERRARILCSPYLRARQTSAAIEQALTAANIRFDVREAIELREIAFGLFDGIPDEELPKRFPEEYEHYEKHKRFEGEFFAPMPLGESRCNVAERVKGVFGTILRDASADRPDPIRDFVIVSHGITIRCFRMQWMHYPWEWYEGEQNPRNCSIQLIEGRFGRGYTDQLAFEGYKSPRLSQTRREEGHVGPGN
jgi:2,3-bisphosphoglycerate-dependent phosphoglycerate mutase